MSKAFVDFRGERHEVEYRDYGYEPDTNAHTIDWDFVELRDITLTDAEEERIYIQLVQLSYEDRG